MENILGFAPNLPPNNSHHFLTLAFNLCRANVNVKVVNSFEDLGHSDHVREEAVVRGERHNTVQYALNCRMPHRKGWIVMDSKTGLFIYDTRISFQHLGVLDWNLDENRFWWVVGYIDPTEYKHAQNNIDDNHTDRWMMVLS